MSNTATAFSVVVGSGDMDGKGRLRSLSKFQCAADNIMCVWVPSGDRAYLDG